MSEDRKRRAWFTGVHAAVAGAGALVLLPLGGLAPQAGSAPPPRANEASHATIVMREGRGTLVGKLVGTDHGGVSLRLARADGVADDASTLRIVAWDRLLRVEGGVAAEPIAGMSDAAWRAISRIERGDTWSAEGLLNELAAKCDGQRGPTVAAVYDGLLRCRMARGARAGAVTAWVSWLGVMERSGAVRGEGAGIGLPTEWVGGAIAGAPVVDLRTGLPVDLAPMWVNEPALAASAGAGEWVRAAGTGERGTLAGELAAWYQVAARFEERGDTDVAEWPREAGTIEGARLVRWIVQARVGDAERRAAARTQLQGVMALETTEPWMEAWCRAAIGRSLIRESEPAERVRGVIEMLHVPARLGSASPMLAAVCLAEAAVVMHELGDQAAASSLKQELVASYPGQPAAGWSRLAEIPAAAPTPAGGAAGQMPDERAQIGGGP